MQGEHFANEIGFGLWMVWVADASLGWANVLAGWLLSKSDAFGASFGDDGILMAAILDRLVGTFRLTSAAANTIVVDEQRHGLVSKRIRICP